MGTIADKLQKLLGTKEAIRQAIIAKGQAVAEADTFASYADKIRAIQSGGVPAGAHTIELTASPPEGGSVSGGGVASKGMEITVRAEAADRYKFGGWQEDGAAVSDLAEYAFQVTVDRALKAVFEEMPTEPVWAETTLPASAYWTSVTYGNGKFVAVASSNSNKAAYSADGKTWTASTLPSSTYWNSVTYGDGKFVAVASVNSNKAAYSADGKTWTASTLPSSANWNSVTYGDGRFLAVSNNTNVSVYSADGINWTQTLLPISANWRSVTYGDGMFVAVADSSNKAAYTL